jgi:hypothetical protein
MMQWIITDNFAEENTYKIVGIGNIYRLFVTMALKYFFEQGTLTLYLVLGILTECLAQMITY